MKRICFVLMVLALNLPAVSGFAQNIAINEDGSAPNPNAILDVKSSTKGVLIPRVSTAGRLAIPNTKGLLVYDTTAGSFFFNNGTAWQNMLPPAITGWSLTGNSGTTSNNFLGTSDHTPLTVRVNNLLAGRIEPDTTYNTFWGYSAGNSNLASLPPYNTGIGAFALQANQSGQANTATGTSALQSNISGTANTANGVNTLHNNTNGSFNTATGHSALYGNTTAYYNTADGYNALAQNTTGGINTALGAFALQNNTTSGGNVGIGMYALTSNTIYGGNTAVGASALYASSSFGNTAVGFSALGANTSGGYNTAIGDQTLSSNTTGSFNIGIGLFANVSSPNLSNAVAIGYNTVVNASNKVRIGNSSVTVIEGQVPFTTPSDGRFKYQVQEDVKGLDFILQLRPVTYRFDVKRFDEQLHGSVNTAAIGARTKINGIPADNLQTNKVELAAYDEASAIRRSGFIAQEVEKAAAVSGYDFSGIIRPKTDQDHYSLSYESFVVPLVKAVQELKAIIADQQKQIDELKKQIAK